MTDIKPDLVITDLPSPAPDNPLEALSWLGDTVEEVAEGLRARGIKGNRETGGAYQCPIARYLNTWWEKSVVSQSTFCVWTGISYTTCTPAPIGAFVRAWDSYAFPDLIDNG